MSDKCLGLSLTSLLFLVFLVYFVYHNNFIDSNKMLQSVTISVNSNSSVNSGFLKSVNILRNSSDKTYKTILMWNNRNAAKWLKFDGTLTLFEDLQCQEKRYSATDLPKHRSSNQRYIFFSLEAPSWCPIRDLETRGLYNWTMTYKPDSDFARPYGKLVRMKEHPGRDELERHIAGSRNELSLAWVASKCGSMSKREQLVRNLKSHMDVKIYGNCSDLQCPPGKNHHECMQKLEKTHKFYLSFENAICDDYVTEKFFKVLDHSMIPIVLGGADYSKIAPPKSYINALDFENVSDLANYLKMLHKNNAKFAEYFWWRDFYEVVKVNPFCDLCQRLHNPDEPQKVYGEDLKEWWNGNCSRLNQKSLIKDDEIKLVQM